MCRREVELEARGAAEGRTEVMSSEDFCRFYLEDKWLRLS